MPIIRYSIELDWRFAGGSYEKPHSSVLQNHPFLVQRHQERMAKREDYSRLGGENEIDFWTIHTTPVGLGNPPLHLDALIDTSWTAFFAASVNCTYNAREKSYCIIHPLYNSSLSSTYRADLSPCKMIYWGTEGIQTHGAVSMDSISLTGLQIPNQTFLEATRWHPGSFTSDQFFDTVLGLALYAANDSWGNFSAPGPFQNMINQQVMKENVFSLTLPRNDDERGEIVFGGMPGNITRKDLVEIPVNNTRVGEGDSLWDFYTSSGWQISVHNITMMSLISGELISVLVEPHIAIIASALPYIALPEKAAKKVDELIGLTNGGTWVNCTTRSSLPEFMLTFDAGKWIRLTAWDYLLEVFDDIDGKLKCVSTFVSLGDSGNSGAILIGSPFLSGLYSVFDADRKSISFANRPLSSR
ncbi:aspartic peptidase domain-containing protein [Dendryphion nanum]|uniref:Aspartic peptidase domain-containing protein n=1 Tax=Dendryphion nanum TaxID=256645 RepID=A0A9P9E0M1_9PLEO|nr:aspartic peptidase domain-containing protein [Dendryphion nanum]